LDKDVIDLLQNAGTTKVLTTVDEHGVPHSVVKGSLALGEDGNLVVLELIESSHTHRNLTRSIWYDRPVAILLKGEGEGDRAYQIKGVPIKLHVSGPVFRRYYTEVRDRLGDVGLAGVWVIRPDEVINQSWRARYEQERAERPTFTHLDRLVAV